MKPVNPGISNEIYSALPQVKLGVLNCRVLTAESSEELNEWLNAQCSIIQSKLDLAVIHGMKEIHATREAYKALGKEPSRYRPSAEALLRRVIQGKGLYAVNNVVDTLNCISAVTGFSIGGYDVRNISGRAVLRKGKADAKYEAIGRGILNIENLPVLYDDNGPFGSPTSDSVRTSVHFQTEHFMMVFFSFGDHSDLNSAMQFSAEKLEKFAGGCEFELKLI